jgi:hypothetical protein
VWNWFHKSASGALIAVSPILSQIIIDNPAEAFYFPPPVMRVTAAGWRIRVG